MSAPSEQNGSLCVACKKLDCGDGIWLHPAGRQAGIYKDSLCPDCCRARFPQFYSDCPTPPKKGLASWVAAISKLLKRGAR
jgi:hypothetical protein